MKKRFRIFLIVYSLILIAAIGAGLFYVWGLLIDYEASIPDVNMEKHLTDFDENNIKTLYAKFPLELEEYEDKEAVADRICASVEDAELSYRKRAGAYTNSAPVYDVLAGENVIATAAFAESGKNNHGFSVWEMSDVSFAGYGLEFFDVTIKVPLDAVVFVNGRVIDESYRTSEEPAALVKNISEFVEQVPGYKTYTLGHLANMPEIEVNGENIYKADSEEHTVFYEFGTDEELKSQVAGRITAMTREFGAYIINKGSLSRLQSYMVGKAKGYVSNIPAVWAYLVGEEYNYTFTNETIENFVRYSEDCFSCEACYTLNVTYRKTRSISYDTKLVCTYVKQDGAWYLADFIMENKEDLKQNE